MKKVILLNIFLFSWLFISAEMMQAAPQCDGNSAGSGVSDPACWTSKLETVTGSHGNCWYTTDPSTGCYWCSYACDDGATGVWCVNHPCGGPSCASGYSYDTTVYKCNYIESFDYSACGLDYAHVQNPVDANWAAKKLTEDCENAKPQGLCNSKPMPPSLTGPANCDSGVDCVGFKISAASEDPDGDNIYYQIKWNDINDDSEIEPFPGGEVPSGQTPSNDNNKMSHSWNAAGVKYAKARACDSYPHADSAKCSDWSTEISVNVLECGSNMQSYSIKCTDLTNETSLSKYVTDYDPSMSSEFTINRILRDGCSEDAIKCKNKCDDSTGGQCGDIVYKYNPVGPKCELCTPNCCESTTCAGQTCANSCGQEVQGVKDCRQENWVEQSPE